MKQKIDHYGEKEMAPLSPTDRGKKRRRQLPNIILIFRKRKLVVDEIKAITGEEMKAQLSDTSDIVTTLGIPDR